MSTVVGYAALLCVAAGLVAAALVAVRTGDGRSALRIALDFWLAGALLRLGLPGGAESLLAAAVVIVVRQVVVAGLGAPAPGGRSADAPAARR